MSEQKHKNQLQTIVKPTQETAPATAPAEAASSQVINEFIQNTDWDAFWVRVMKRTAPQIEAYEMARVKSLQSAPQHVFM
jgi:hypothetical protein